MDKKILAIIGVVAAIIVIVIALFATGIMHNGSVATPGSTYGPGTYVIGTDLPVGTYDFSGDYEMTGSGTFQASSQGGLSISDTGVHLESGAVVTIHEGGSLTYRDS